MTRSRLLGVGAAASLLTVTMTHAQQRTTAEDREMALALSAAPAHLAAATEVRVLRNGRYEVVRAGTNGFTCMVEHEDPRSVEPVCYDAAGAEAFLPVANAREQWRLEKHTEAEIRDRIDAGFRAGRFRAPSRPGIAYMLSAEQTVRDAASGDIVPFVPHLMFYAPHATAAELGLESPDVAAPAGRPFLVFERDPRGLIIVPLGGPGH